ncbi:MAG: LPS export ABC transporter periplasmic protein LptC [Bacteroidota bacterium]
MDLVYHKLIYSSLKRLLVFPGVFFLLFSCENDIEKIKSLTDPSELPNVRAKTVEIIYTDSSELEMILEAPSIKQFNKDVDRRPHIEFPEGIHVKFYDDSMNIESEITANYAIYYQDDKLWEAKGNVVAHNIEKGKLNTEVLFWDENKELIYSNTFSRIETEDGTFYGQDGFESNQRFTKWRLKGSRGTVNIKEADEENETPEN